MNIVSLVDKTEVLILQMKMRKMASANLDSICTLLLIVCSSIVHTNIIQNEKITFLFPEFQYKETSKNVSKIFC